MKKVAVTGASYVGLSNGILLLRNEIVTLATYANHDFDKMSGSNS